MQFVKKIQTVIFAFILGLCLMGCTYAGKTDVSDRTDGKPATTAVNTSEEPSSDVGMKSENDVYASADQIIQPQTEDDLQENVPETGNTANTANAANTSGDGDSLTADSTGEDTDEPEENTDPEVTIYMVGDILLHTPIEEASKRDDGSYDYSHIFDETRDLIREADISLVNQEVIIGGSELGISGYPAFNASYEIGDALADAGFDVVLHATNHVLDKGARGVENCYSYWENAHPEIEVLGIHDSFEDKSQISLLTVNDITIAFLNYTYGTNGIEVPSDKQYLVDILYEETVLEDLARAEEMADFTVVCPHWGTEYRLSPDSYQEKWAKKLAQGGADLVIGTHPHVIEPVEWVDDTLVYYSLGNFVNWTSGTGPGTANRMLGGMAEITIGKDPSGKAYIKEYGVEPLVTDLHDGPDGVTVYRLEDYSEDMADENAIRRQDPEFSYRYLNDLCDEVWGNLWKKP